MLGPLLLAFPAAALALLLALVRRAAAAERAMLAVAGLVLVTSALLSPVAPVNDPWTHYLHLRAALVEPWRLLDLWDRPGFTLLAAGPAAFGIVAARLAAVVTALVAIAATMRAGAAAGIGRPWLAGALTLAQHDFFGQATSTMTELPFAAAFAVAALGWARDRPWLVAGGLGWMGITRPEGPALAALGAVAILLRWRRAAPAIAAAAPFALYAAAGAIVFMNPRWMIDLNPYRGLVAVRLEPEQLVRSYFFVALGLSQGAALVVLEAAGLAAAATGRAARLRFLLAPLALTFLLLTFLEIGETDAWRESRYLVSVAPALALLAAAGLEAGLACAPRLGPPLLLALAAAAGAHAVAVYWAKVGAPLSSLRPPLLTAALAAAALLWALRARIPPAAGIAALLLLPVVAVPPGILSRHRGDVVALSSGGRPAAGAARGRGSRSRGTARAPRSRRRPRRLRRRGRRRGASACRRR